MHLFNPVTGLVVDATFSGNDFLKNPERGY